MIKNKKTILLVIDQISHGGAERILIDFNKYLNPDYNTLIFSLIKPNSENEWLKDLSYSYGIVSNSSNLAVKLFQQFFLVFKLQMFVLKHNPNVIFSFLERSNIITTILFTKSVKIITVHNLLSIQYLKLKSALLKRCVLNIIQKTYNSASVVVAVSNQVKMDLIDNLKIKKDNIVVINNKVNRNQLNSSKHDIIDDYSFTKEKKYLINIGRFSDQKAQWRLLKAFSHCIKIRGSSDLHLILMGTGENELELKELMLNLGLSDYVSFIKFNKNPYKYLTKCDLLVLSSNYEGFPIVVAESSSLGIPFMGSSKSIPKEVFNNTQTWLEATFDVEYMNKDLSLEIHPDEINFGEKINSFFTSDKLLNDLKKATQNWESNNDINNQFNEYIKLFNT